MSNSDPNLIQSQFSQRPIVELSNGNQMKITEYRQQEDGDKGEEDESIKEPKLIESEFSATSIEELSNGSEIKVTEYHQQQKYDESTKELKLRSLGEFVVAEEDDGFRTPTSIDHKISLGQRCPLAPRKPKSCSMKRRQPSSNVVHLRIKSKELETMFNIKKS